MTRSYKPNPAGLAFLDQAAARDGMDVSTPYAKALMAAVTSFTADEVAAARRQPPVQLDELQYQMLGRALEILSDRVFELEGREL